MVRKKGVRVKIIVEDESLERFSRNVLIKLGYSRSELRFEPFPVGKGSAKDWVDKVYPNEVRILRSRSYQKLALVVGTDADELSVPERKSRLAEALHDESMVARADGERIVFWIPRWNIETWVLYFDGDRRDEDHN